MNTNTIFHPVVSFIEDDEVLSYQFDDDGDDDDGSENSGAAGKGGKGGGGGKGEGDDDGDGGDEGGGGEDFDFNLSRALAHDQTHKTITDWAERELVAPLKKKHDKALGRLIQYKMKNDETGEDEYIDPKEALAAIKQVRSGKAPEVRDEVNRAIEATSAKYEADISEVKNERDALRAKLDAEVGIRHGQMVDYALGGHLIDSGIKPGKRHLHELYLKKFLSVQENETGREEVVVVDDNGKTRYGSSGLMSIEEFINEYRSRDGVAEDWNPNIVGGSGTGPNMGSRSKGRVIDQTLSPTERLKIMRQIERK